MLDGSILLGVFVALIAVMIFLTTKLKLHAFLAILLTGITLGLVAGLAPSNVLELTVEGAGNTLGYIALIVLLATIIGEILEKTGSAITISESITRLVGNSRAPLAIALTGYLVAIPVMCNDTAFIILAPIAQALAFGTGFSSATFSIALAAGAYTSFKLVFPAAPLYPATMFGANVGKVLALGLLVSVPVFVVGMIWAYRCCSRFGASKNASISYAELKKKYTKLPSAISSYMPILIPLVLILFKSLFDAIFSSDNLVRSTFNFIGNPVIALLAGVVVAALIAGRNTSKETLGEWMSNGVKRSASILAIVGAGGAFGKILEATGLGLYIGNRVLTAGVPAILVPFLVAAAIKTAQGSSMVTMVTAPSIILPILPALNLSPVVATLAVSAGALICVNVNDSFFWVVTGFSEMNAATGIKALTLLSIIQGIVAFAVVAVLGTYFG